MPRTSHHVVAPALALLAVLAAGGCGGSEPRTQAGIAVVATTSILGDLVANVVADAGAVEVLMDAGVDPHAFEPSAADAERLRRADLVVANGLDLETGLIDALAGAEADGVAVLRVAEHVDPLPYSAPHLDEDDEDGHDDDGEQGELDPHFWLDPVRTADAVTLIGQRIGEVAPEVAEAVRDRAEEYRARVLDLHRRIGGILSAVPEGDRRLVSNHDALTYLAARYGFEVVATVVPGGTTLADPSSRELSELVRTVRETGVRAIFVETTAPVRLARSVSGELEGQVEVVELYTGSLDVAGSGAETYLGMMETNARRVAEGLTG